jgi:hypothetical protein
MWKKYFKVVGIVPGPVIIQGVGEIDFASDKLDKQMCLQLFENDCRYLQLTAEGREHFYGKPKSLKRTQKKRTSSSIKNE